MKLTEFFSIRFILAFTVLTSLWATSTVAGTEKTKSTPSADIQIVGEPLIVPRATQYDIESHVNGQKYRIMVSIPQHTDPNKAYAIFYVLDGNWYFLSTAESVAEKADDISSAIVVGIAYQIDDKEEIERRRAFDMTLPGGATSLNSCPAGGGDEFIRVLLEEIKPFVQARYKVDETRQTLYGKSLGGLIVLRVLFLHPDAFQTYVAASPAIWWSDKAVLADEERFTKLAKTGHVNSRLLIISASEEQYQGTDSKELELADKYRMVDNASELAERLANLKLANVVVNRAIIADEDHNSVSLASIGRALMFALPK
jgi:predicted alpha/beta superfamily hydrolase